MKFKVPTREQVDEKAKGILDTIEDKVGMVPNIYAFTGSSANALESYMAFNGAQENGTFSAKEREAVALAVAQVNGCRYCQSAHTAVGKMNGFSEEETELIRKGEFSDERISAISKLAADIQRTHGDPDEKLLKDFADQGFGQDALVDLVALVVANNFTNYIHGIADFEIDFPVAKEI